MQIQDFDDKQKTDFQQVSNDKLQNSSLLIACKTIKSNHPFRNGYIYLTYPPKSIKKVQLLKSQNFLYTRLQVRALMNPLRAQLQQKGLTKRYRNKNIQRQLKSIERVAQDRGIQKLFDCNKEELIQICQTIKITQQTVVKIKLQQDTYFLENNYQQSSHERTINNKRAINKSLVKDLPSFLANIQFSDEEIEDGPIWQTITDKNLF